MVLSIFPGECLLLDTEGFNKRVSLVEIGNKLTKAFVGKNQYSQEVKARYSVKVINGKHKGRNVLVKKIYNSVLFLFDKNEAKDHGIFVENLNNCVVINTYNYTNIANQGKFNNERADK